MNISLNNLPSNLFSGQVCFFFPSKIVGGHELMAIELIKEFNKISVPIKIVFLTQNREIQDRIQQAKIDADFLGLNICQPKLEFLHTTLNILYLFKVKNIINQIREFSQGSIIIVQGDIELGSAYIKLANKKDIDLYSYIPYAHSAKKMGKAFYFFRDLIYPSLYKKVNKYITISNQFKFDLEKYNKDADIYIVENKVRQLDNIKELRANNKKINGKFNIAIIGRVSFKQKGHDILVDALSLLEEKYIKNIKLHVVGDGNDLMKLNTLLSQKCPMLEVIYHGWSKEPWEKIYDVELVVIPSRFEGVPLVMLEAIELGIDILASNTDGMVDYLSANELFNNVNDLSMKIVQIMGK